MPLWLYESIFSKHFTLNYHQITTPKTQNNPLEKKTYTVKAILVHVYESIMKYIWYIYDTTTKWCLTDPIKTTEKYNHTNSCSLPNIKSYIINLLIMIIYKLRIPGGEKSIFTVVIHQWRLPLHLLRVQKQSTNFTSQYLAFIWRHRSTVVWRHNSKSEQTILGHHCKMSNWLLFIVELCVQGIK